ncbi:hypothetical protein MKW98_012800 [Papaver atlanticum]|uniref:PGG domain-containing protein n=1 Tax=Papaver atlanticum TaxID=357466 RepID=A0AAD4SL12_9MAGN|nr:hypothetical protein MKW98_012800 [Papaver atlanticum]
MDTIHDVTQRGGVESLRRILDENPDFPLAYFTCFLRTTLHEAAIRGHVELAREIVNRVPELTMKMVTVLLNANTDACVVQDKNGGTPLHLAAMRDEVEVMDMLIEKRPEAIHQRLMNSNETILHLSVKNSSHRAMFKLAEYLVENRTNLANKPDEISVNSIDSSGNTILHLAAQLKEMKMFNFLMQNVVLRIDINIRNNEGVTALQMLDRKEMEALGMSCYDYHTTREEVRQQEIEVPQQRTTSKNEWLKERMNTIMIVAALIAGIAFQAVINPPGGVFQEDSKIDSVKEPVMFTYYLRNFINNTATGEGFQSYYSHVHNLPQQKTTRDNITADDIITYRANFVNDLLTAAKNSESLARSVFTYKSKKLAPGIILDDDWWMNITSNFNTTYGGGSGFSPYLMQYAGNAIMACASPNAYQSYILLNSLALVVCALTVLIVTFDAIKQRPSSRPTTSIVRYLEVLVATAVACIILSYAIVIKTIAPPFWDYGYVKSQLRISLVAFTCMPLLTFHILGSRTLSRFGV